MCVCVCVCCALHVNHVMHMYIDRNIRTDYLLKSPSTISSYHTTILPYLNTVAPDAPGKKQFLISKHAPLIYGIGCREKGNIYQDKQNN